MRVEKASTIFSEGVCELECKMQMIVPLDSVCSRSLLPIESLKLLDPMRVRSASRFSTQ